MIHGFPDSWLDALVDEAHALRRKTAAHAHGATAIKRAIRAGIDSIEHGTFADDEALTMMKDRGTYLIPAMMAAEGLREAFAAGRPIPPAIAAKAKLAIAQLARPSGRPSPAAYASGWERMRLSIRTGMPKSSTFWWITV